MALKVLHLIDSGGLYGAEKMLLDLAKRQVEQGLCPIILSAGTPNDGLKSIEREAGDLGVPIKAWRMAPGMNIREAFRIVKWAQSEGFDILHSHGYKFNILLGALPWRCRRLPFVSTLHGYTYSRRLSKAWWYKVLDKIALFRSSRIIVVASKAVSQIPFFVRIRRPVILIENGIDAVLVKRGSFKELDPKISLFLAGHSPVVLGVGRLSREKNFEELLKSISELKNVYPDVGLILAGDGPLSEELSEQVEALSLNSCVLLPGYVEGAHALIKSVSALVIPSLSEGLPITLLEAMALETGVLVTDVGEMKQVVGDGKGGYIIDRPYSKEITVAVNEFFSSYEERQMRIKWASNCVEEKYSIDRMAAAYQNVYRSVLKTEIKRVEID